MKLLTEKASISDAVFVPTFNEETSFFQQQYDFLVNCYNKLKETQDTLEKLKELSIIGNTYAEEKFVASLKEFKTLLLNKNEEQIKEQLLVVREQFSNYLAWLKENSSLPVYLLRQDIENSKLDYEDLLALAYLLSLTKSKLKEDIDKFELLLTELHKRIIPEQFSNLLDYIMPISDLSLSEKTKEKISNALELIDKIKQTESFYKLVLTNLLSDARSLKQELRENFWHKEVIFVVVMLDLEVKKQFKKFAIEKNDALKICNKMLENNYNSISELAGGNTLNITAAKKFIENLDEVLAQDYESHKDDLKQAAQVFEVVYQANENWQKLAKESNSVVSQKINPREFLADNLDSPLIKPLIETHKSIGIVEVEKQLVARTDEFIAFIAQNGRTDELFLRYTKLNLSKNEIIALSSKGKALDTSFHVHQYNLTRKVIGLIAEFQETFAFLTKPENSLKHNFSSSILTYLSEYKRRLIHEIEVLFQQVNKHSNMGLAVELMELKNKLAKTAEKDYQP